MPLGKEQTEEGLSEGMARDSHKLGMMNGLGKGCQWRVLTLPTLTPDVESAADPQ